MAARKSGVKKVEKKSGVLVHKKTTNNPETPKAKPIGFLAGVKKMPTKSKVFLIALIAVLAFMVYSGFGWLVAASVNGSPILRLSVIRDLEKQGGQQSLDNLVNEAIIRQEASKAGISIGEDQVSAEIDALRSRLSEQGQDLDSLLSMQGMSVESFREQVEIQLTIEGLLSERIEVVQSEIDEFIEQNKDFLPEEISSEELNNLAKEELSQQKLSAEFATWLEEARSNASIRYFVNY